MIRLEAAWRYGQWPPGRSEWRGCFHLHESGQAPHQTLTDKDFKNSGRWIRMWTGTKLFQLQRQRLGRIFAEIWFWRSKGLIIAIRSFTAPLWWRLSIVPAIYLIFDSPSSKISFIPLTKPILNISNLTSRHYLLLHVCTCFHGSSSSHVVWVVVVRHPGFCSMAHVHFQVVWGFTFCKFLLKMTDNLWKWKLNKKFNWFCW